MECLAMELCVLGEMYVDEVHKVSCIVENRDETSIGQNVLNTAVVGRIREGRSPGYSCVGEARHTSDTETP